MNPHRIARFLRLATLAVFLFLAYQGLSRFRPWTLHASNDSMAPAFPGGSRVLMDYSPRPTRLGDAVLYELGGKGRTARVAGLGGDLLEVREGMLHVNGTRTVHPIADPDLLPARVPPGELFLLNDNPDSRHPDSLVHGPLPAARVRGRILISLDFF